MYFSAILSAIYRENIFCQPDPLKAWITETTFHYPHKISRTYLCIHLLFKYNPINF